MTAARRRPASTVTRHERGATSSGAAPSASASRTMRVPHRTGSDVTAGTITTRRTAATANRLGHSRNRASVAGVGRAIGCRPAVDRGKQVAGTRPRIHRSQVCCSTIHDRWLEQALSDERPKADAAPRSPRKEVSTRSRSSSRGSSHSAERHQQKSPASSSRSESDAEDGNDALDAIADQVLADNTDLGTEQSWSPAMCLAE